MSAEQAPWQDAPTCHKCKASLLSCDVPSDDNVCDDDGEWPAVKLEALNDERRPGWMWCSSCGIVETGHAAYKQRQRADEWWARPDREEAWAELQRQRRVDAIEAEHARRQLTLFGLGQADPEAAP